MGRFPLTGRGSPVYDESHWRVSQPYKKILAVAKGASGGTGRCPWSFSAARRTHSKEMWRHLGTTQPPLTPRPDHPPLGDPRRDRGAPHLCRPGQPLRGGASPGQGTPPARHSRGAAGGRQGRRTAAPQGPLRGASQVGGAVPGGVVVRRAPRHRGRHRKISGLRAHQGHRPGTGPTPGGPFRCRDPDGHR